MNGVKEIIGFLHKPTGEDIALIEKAYAIAKEAHKGQTRLTGEPYFVHVFETAKMLAELKMDTETIVAGLLHDSIEDERLSEEYIQKEFGETILFLINGVTKLGKLKYKGLKRHAESLRKLFIATSQDMRVLIIRLADRLHNVKTLDGHPKEDKRKRIATETLEVFAPLAHRLGMWQLQGELEDYSFKHVLPEEYEAVKSLLKQKSSSNKKFLEKIKRALQIELAAQGLKDAKVNYRIKRLYSLYRKLLRKDMNIDAVHDFYAVRIVLGTVEDCYKVLGIVHKLWQPLPERIKDYIAMPKPNGYQSLHTTIFTGDGSVVEIQIRTKQMDLEAEFGIASHLTYKELQSEDGVPQSSRRVPVWIKQMLEWQKTVSESGEFLDHLKMDFFEFRVFIFTPKGDVIDLPEGSSVIDFAFAIHTDIGEHLSSAKVNGKMSSLETKLKNGDIVEVITNKNSKPSSKWLNHAKTTLAQRKIRSSLAENGNFFIKNFLPKI